MSLLVGCPVILPPRDDVVASWTHRSHLIVCNGAYDEWLGSGLDVAKSCLISGDGTNIGVAASWNRIFRYGRELGISHVALISQGTVLDGGTAKLAGLVDEYADWRGLLTDFAWHCIVLSVALWEEVGLFDERYLAYYEDCDYVRRLEILGLHTASNPMPKVGRDQLDGTEIQAGALKAGAIDPSVYGHSGALYREAWGGDPGYETLIDPRPVIG